MQSALAQDVRLSILPPICPRTVEETGLSPSFLVELVSKQLYDGGAMTLAALSERLALPMSVAGDIANFLRKERLAEIRKGGDVRASYVFALTDLGRERAREFLQASGYIGPAPVTLERYADTCRKQSVRKMAVTAEKMAKRFEGIVLPPGMLDRLGPAMNSGRSLFLYGPPGSGKTFIAERLSGILDEHIFIPYAVSVEGHVIRIFDPVNHRSFDVGGSLDSVGELLEGGPRYDRRFALCERPVVIAGGELTLGMLDLNYDPLARYYEAPLQLKANGGIFLIDDLGRQMVRPFDLFNRWIIPLEKGCDYLTLQTGKKFEIPFDQIVIFSTNIEPRDLADEAFLRRLGYKIRIGYISPSEYVSICRQVCRQLGLEFRPEAIRHLIEKEHAARKIPLAACHPKDVLSRVVEICRYRGIHPRLDEDLVAQACRDYFMEI
ncbi:MAG: ATP-binding protein [Deltaproteobacteria bacterium]|nr:ATP-binding protein [Deltaproteobacteria bacterium]